MSAARVLKIGKPPIALSATDRDIGVATGLAPEDVIKVVCDSGFKHVVQTDGIAYDSEVQTAKIMIQSPGEFMDDPIKAILGGGPVNAQSRTHMIFDATHKKKDALANFGDFVAKVKGSRSIWDVALMIADELYTNSAKNAWPKGAPLFQGPPARTGTVELFAQADAQRLIMGCRDSFGDLQSQHVLERIKTCFQNGVASSIRHGTTGAGIGSYLIFDACIAYYAGVEAGQRSVVCVALPLGMGHKTRNTLPKNIHLLP